MDKRKFLLFFSVIVVVFLRGGSALAQQAQHSQTLGGMTRQEADRQKQDFLEKRVEKIGPIKNEAVEEEILTADTGPKVMVSTITVEGVSILLASEIDALVAPFQGRELSFAEMQKVADLITDEYRKRGYVTSRAYMPPQKIMDAVLLIRVVEGKVGEVEIKGNRYFSSRLLKDRIGIEPEGYFDYSDLQKSLVYVNEHPDRVAKAILVPGKDPGTTDIMIEVEDHMPFHVKFSYDNYGSRYINENRYGLTLEHNNLTGHDDKIYVKGMFSDETSLLAQQARYAFPVTSQLELGAYMLHSEVNLAEEFEDLESEGEAAIFGVFSNYAFIERDDLEVRLNLGFDSKNITDELSGIQTSRDELRIVKAGLDADFMDSWGRTILTAEVDNGIPNFLGSMDIKDPDASRVGAGGKFTKGMFNLFRLQPTPFSTSLLLKNSFQYSNNVLASAEQFLVGGPTSVRGYPPGEYSGDKGFFSSAELSLPFYGLSKDLKIPFRKEKLYDAFRFVVFWDIGTVHLKNPQAGDREDVTLRGAGFGGRLTVSDELECRVEVGYPLGGLEPSDGSSSHTWMEFHLKI